VKGRVHQISVSRGGVPKLGVRSARVTALGVEGDSQNDTKHHGGPDRAVCLFSFEVIQGLQGEGHPIAPGSTGENLTLAGIDWPRVVPGGRFEFEGGVVLEVVSFTRPCSTIRDSFAGLLFNRIHQEQHPGQSRVYARVIRGGSLGTGEGCVYTAPAGVPVG